MLVLRCDRCRTTVWLSQENPESADCSHCKKRYEFTAQLRGRSLEELHQQARGLARQLVIDLPSAVSMMLDVLKLTQVQDYLSGDNLEKSPEHVEEPSSVVGVDPAFEESIKAGRLGRMEALQRGNREHYATKLISRHGISEDEAYAVADNRELLLAIVKRREAASPRTIVAPLPSRSTWKVALAAAEVRNEVLGRRHQEVAERIRRQARRGEHQVVVGDHHRTRPADTRPVRPGGVGFPAAVGVGVELELEYNQIMIFGTSSGSFVEFRVMDYIDLKDKDDATGIGYQYELYGVPFEQEPVPPAEGAASTVIVEWYWKTYPGNFPETGPDKMTYMHQQALLQQELVPEDTEFS